MAIPRLPFVFGGGVSTNYTGPEVCEPWDCPSVTVQIPYVDLVQQKIAYREQTFGFARQIGGGAEMYQILEMIWQGVKNEFIELNLPDRALLVQTTLSPGKNESINASDWANIHSYEIILDDATAPNIDKWWGDNDMGKYGYINFTYDNLAKAMPMHWLNSRWNLVQNDVKETNGWSVYLFPNVYGNIIGYGRLLPEPLVYSGTYSGTYPPS